MRNIYWSCSETSVFEQLPLKNAVLQGFSLKNCKTCSTTNRVVSPVYLLVFICLSSYSLSAEQVKDHNNNGHIDSYDIARSKSKDCFLRNGDWYYINQGDIDYARNAANYSRKKQKTQDGSGHPALIFFTISVGIYLTKKILDYYKEKEYQERLRIQRIEKIRQKETIRQRMVQEQLRRQRAAQFLAQKEREYQEQLRRQLFEEFIHEYKREAPPPKAPPQHDMISFYRSLLGLRLQFTQDELKNAYREAVKKYHPDTYTHASRRDCENAETLMRQVNEAYEVLKG
ncbi:hypothetical protein FACS189468_5470 [Spirochaetia bacterium]|nr:hypothetical protein FACS189468_5470 [Spirochaetia bacterium]